MQCKKKTVDPRACGILNKFKPYLGKLYTRRQERLQGYKGLTGPLSGSLNMCHHVRILGIVIWPLPGSCGRGWWTRRDQREGACVSHQKTTRTREAAFPGGKEGRGLELCKGRETADIQQSWWSLYRPHGHHTPGGYHNPWGCLERHRDLARELHQSTTVIWGTGEKFWLQHLTSHHFFLDFGVLRLDPGI